MCSYVLCVRKRCELVPGFCTFFQAVSKRMLLQVRSSLEIAVDENGKRLWAPETESAEESLRRRQHFSTSERKSGVMDMPEKVRRLVQDMWFPVHNFVNAERSVVWSCIESSPVTEEERWKKTNDNATRADNLFHNTVGYKKSKKRKLTKRFMCHLTKVKAAPVRKPPPTCV